MIRSYSICMLTFLIYSPLFAQHSTGASVNLGAISSFNRSVDHYLIGFEKNAGLWYRYQPTHAAFGLQTSLSFGLKNYVFRFEKNNAALLKQHMVNTTVMASIKLNKNGAQLLAGFNAALLTHSQTEFRYTGSNTNYYYSDNNLNALQHSNTFQVDVCLELDQGIGEKQNFMVGLNVAQNVNRILTADFKYIYHDTGGSLHYLQVSDNLCPLTASIVFRYKIK